MDPIKQLADELFRERVAAARRMKPEEKLFAGARLFEEVCERMRAGIRYQFPDADESRVEEILRERLALARRLENRS